jgi:hypothetical protein
LTVAKPCVLGRSQCACASNPRASASRAIFDAFPESKLGLEALEAGIQTTAKRLAVATNICAMSLEGLIDALERYNTGVQIMRPWQV